MDHYLEFISNHSMLVLALAVVTFLLIKEFTEAIFSQFENLSPMQVVTKMNSEELVIIDVREAPEFVLGHIEKAINVPLGKLKEDKKLDSYKQTALLLVCQTGTRSAPACNSLSKMGFEKLFNLDGGMQAWEDNKFPIKITSKNSK
jgi:rhodanese-related sulfurtransferase